MREKFQSNNELSLMKNQFAQLRKLVNSDNVEKWHMIVKEICEIFSLPAIFNWLDAVKLFVTTPESQALCQPMINHAAIDEEVIKASESGYLDVIHYLIKESIIHYDQWADYKIKCFLNQNGQYDNYKLWAKHAVGFILYSDDYKEYNDKGMHNVVLYSNYKNLALLFAFSFINSSDNRHLNYLIKEMKKSLTSPINNYSRNYCAFFHSQTSFTMLNKDIRQYIGMHGLNLIQHELILCNENFRQFLSLFVDESSKKGENRNNEVIENDPSICTIF
ncbi:MAG: hypothetical protein H0U57_04660 [Tatlockia sp.]|nr:hypothetical protein [Tatlockia sp.]